MEGVAMSQAYLRSLGHPCPMYSSRSSSQPSPPSYAWSASTNLPRANSNTQIPPPYSK
ncbi:uncharacterized protein LACBIDRAFT_310930 [Laccaria bicolor S238N-H82]|uniref:Predicted protein n=1 Tax=Laccaria bicolor (strain S238N-H82 / ATCC MYA-4686) TaxID=486041 RepID=B0DG83_LACBS|nr:uncharacterized protein LACBIDRAFT_300184 [Laccaria bicolor S238N-H82]XP_001891245.1 uncharacterized protein LACBIDRAFT_310930 [Laccaria bicolor S238N-H82]EDQ98105.1 predicted protein [Laccaria bicolor S238N-H82]EDR06467.1 predicted protein [Laccaria bicolor S238N-H82]|eukprot:XP_001882839.1 predicted protein [Laccaria bicolor S238N-H82]